MEFTHLFRTLKNAAAMINDVAKAAGCGIRAFRKYTEAN